MRQPFIDPVELDDWKVQLILIALAMIFVPAITFVRALNKSNEGPIYQSYTLLISPFAITLVVVCLMNSFGIRLLLIAILIFSPIFFYLERKQK